nr:14077_t:CDS:2 [Entrophospora candida]
MIFRAIVARSILEYHENEVQERILILSTFSHLYFITLRFSIYGFPTYKVVLFAVLDKVKSDHKELENILNILKPSPPSNKDKSTETSRFVFYLLVIEQSMKELDDEIVENEILPFIYPYLKDKSEIRLYESVHVVILAMFSTKKRISPKLSPFYCNLLLQAYPDLLTVGQLRAAYSIVIRSLSETDDALAWVCLEKLIKAIEDLPTTDNIYSDTNSNIIHSINNILKKNNPSSNNNLQPTNSPFINQLIKSNNEKFIIESAALLFHRGHLLLTLIDQIKSVNLIFLKTLLLKIKNFLTNEPNSISKNAIQKVLFDALSTELDYTKKEAGVKWWLTEGVNICKL